MKLTDNEIAYSLLSLMVQADRKIDKSEALQMVLSMKNLGFGMPSEEFNESNQFANAVERSQEWAQGQKEAMLKELVRVAKADGEIAEAEVKLIILLGVSWGISADDMTSMLVS